MFETKIGRIIGNTPMDMTQRRPVNHLGKMPCNINPMELRNQIRAILDRFPEVKSATGKIRIELADGKKTAFDIEYKDR
jgi:hypothetical protein